MIGIPRSANSDVRAMAKDDSGPGNSYRTGGLRRILSFSHALSEGVAD